MTSRAIRNIVIVGSDTLGWVAATGLARGLQGQANIVVVDAPSQSEPSYYYASQHLVDFHHNLAINQAHLINNGAIQLVSALKLQAWFGGHESIIGANGFLPVYQKMELHQLTKYLGNFNISDYSYAAQAAIKGNKVQLGGAVGSLQASCQLNYRVNSQAYKQFMRGAAEKLGVKYIATTVNDFKLDSKTEFVTAISCANGKDLAVDLIIDNTGLARSVSQLWPAKHLVYEDKPSQFNTLIECRSVTTTKPQPFNTLGAHELGICCHAILENQSITQLYCRSTAQSLPTIQQQFVELLGLNSGDVQIQASELSAGVSGQFFHKNCVAIGTAAGCIPSPVVSALVLTQRAITRLLDLFPGTDCNQSNATEFNRLTGNDFAEAWDYQQFIQFSASFNKKSECFYWIPDFTSLSTSLQQKMALFSAYGRFEDQLNQIYSRRDWLEWLGLFYQLEDNLDPLLVLLEPQQVACFLTQLKHDVATQTSALSH